MSGEASGIARTCFYMAGMGPLHAAGTKTATSLFVTFRKVGSDIQMND